MVYSNTVYKISVLGLLDPEDWGSKLPRNLGKYLSLEMASHRIQWRTERGGGCSNRPLPRNSEGPPKSCQTQPDCENC